MFNDLITNVNNMKKQNHEIIDALKEGYTVAFYDEHTNMIMVEELTPSGELKIQIIEDAHFISINNNK